MGNPHAIIAAKALLDFIVWGLFLLQTQSKFKDIKSLNKIDNLAFAAKEGWKPEEEKMKNPFVKAAQEMAGVIRGALISMGHYGRSMSNILGTAEICGICGEAYIRHLDDEDFTVCPKCMELFEEDHEV